MNFLGIVLVVGIVVQEAKWSTASQLVQQSSKMSRTARVGKFWKEKNGTSPDFSHGLRETRIDSKSKEYGTNSNSSSSRQLKIPQVNFYSSIPNALSVTGQGIIWLREISAALGTPIPIWIFTIPFFILGIGLMFMPDLTQLNLPLFYPDGAGDKDPLANFPPLPDMEDISGLKFMKQLASQLMPPNVLMEKWG